MQTRHAGSGPFGLARSHRGPRPSGRLLAGLERTAITELEGIGSIFHITRAVAVAPDGSAAGSSLDDSLVSHAVRWDASGNATVLSSSNSEAFGISSNGVGRRVAGWAPKHPGDDMVTYPRLCASPRGATSGRAVDVNASGCSRRLDNRLNR